MENQVPYNVPRTIPIDETLSDKLHELTDAARATGADKAYIVRDQATTVLRGTGRVLVNSFHPVVIIITFPVSDIPQRNPGVERVYC